MVPILVWYYCYVFCITEFLVVQAINAALDRGDSEGCYHALCDTRASIPTVHLFAAALYLDELRNMKCEKQVTIHALKKCL